MSEDVKIEGTVPPAKPITVALKPRPTLKLPARPVIRRPGATIAAKPLPKPVASAPISTTAATVPTNEKPVAVDAQGVGKLPTVEAHAVSRENTVPDMSAIPQPMEALKSVTQKLKGITQQIPMQAVMHKDGIVGDGKSEAQKEAAKHKTARISLSDAIGVAPVKHESAPMKTIKIKRPINIPTATKPLAPQPAVAVPVETTSEVSAETPEMPVAESAESTITQRKTLKISRPGGVVRPSGKFGIKHSQPVVAESAESDEGVISQPNGEVGEIADIPNVALIPEVSVNKTSDGPTWLFALSSLIQAAACVAIGALAWLLFQNTQIAYF